MNFFKHIFLFAIFAVFSKVSDAKHLKESMNKLTSSNDGNSNTNEPAKPIFRNTVKKKKRVTFSDQALDETIGTEPLVSKPADQKCYQEKLKKSSTCVNNNSFSMCSIWPLWILSIYILSLIFTIC